MRPTSQPLVPQNRWCLSRAWWGLSRCSLHFQKLDMVGSWGESWRRGHSCPYSDALGQPSPRWDMASESQIPAAAISAPFKQSGNASRSWFHPGDSGDLIVNAVVNSATSSA